MSGDAFATPVSTNVFDFSVAPTVGAASSPVSTHRKAAKGIGVNLEEARKRRDQKAQQIRKERRADRTNLERRKAKVDGKVETGSSQFSGNSYLRGPGLEFFREKCEQLNIPDYKQRLEATAYLRRILAAGRSPPLDLLVENTSVVRNLTSFLLLTDTPLLQFEATWCITNIACGNAQHISILLQSNVMANFAQLLMKSPKNVSLVQQALWALCNLSNDDAACHAIIDDPVLWILLLWQMGVDCVQEKAEFTSWQTDVSSLSPSYASEIDNPSLASMRHVAFILGNILKLKRSVPLPLPVIQCIFFTFAILLESPDEEIPLDICQSVYFAALYQPEIVQLALEQGFLHRFCEVYEINSPNPALKELALVAICSLLRSPLLFHRRQVLRLVRTFWPHRSFVHLLVDTLVITAARSAEISSVTSSSTAAAGGERYRGVSGGDEDGHMNDDVRHDNDDEMDDNDSEMEASSTADTGTTIVSSPFVRDRTSINSGHNKSSTTTRGHGGGVGSGHGTVSGCVGTVAAAHVAIMQTKSDLLGALRAIVTLPPADISNNVSLNEILNTNIFAVLLQLATRSSYETKLEAGYLFLDLLTAMQFHLPSSPSLGTMVLQTFDALLSAPDVSFVLQCLHCLAQCVWLLHQTRQQHMQRSISIPTELEHSLDLLAMHSNQEITSFVVRIRQWIDVLMGEDDD